MKRIFPLCYKTIDAAIRYRPTLSSDLLTLLITLLFTVLYNTALWQDALSGYDLSEARVFGMAICMFCVMTSLQFVVFVLFAFHWSTKVVLTILLLIAAFVSYYTSTYGTYFDTTMLENILQTDTGEASELLTYGLAFHLILFFVVPSFVIWRVKLKKTSWPKAILRRLLYFIGGIAVLIVSIALSYQDISSLMRNNKELRYLVTPGNYLVSLGQVLSTRAPSADTPRLPIGMDAVLTPADGKKPMLFVIRLGETVRAANWALSGYQRQTTPKLAQQTSVINFEQMASCGTSTAVSLPCMFSLLDRHDYDKTYARQHESLLDVLAHAGMNVIWIDNQSGCKGVCDGVTSLTVSAEDYPELCEDGHCFDEALAVALRRQVEKQNLDDTVIVLHQLGNHGPSYFQRYPDTYEQFTPTCATSDLAQCSQEEITNSYDNAILYTDTVINQVIETLADQSKYDASMIYLSDHGESLGEKGLYLHGIPYAIAPKEQTHVPMLWWISDDFSQRKQINTECMLDVAKKPTSHDNLFHSVLGLLGISTEIYRNELDVSYPCIK